MNNITKKEQRELRILTEKAFLAELDTELAKLADKFEDWKKDNINAFELSDIIHRFHDGESRETWKYYNYSNDLVFIAVCAL